MFKKIPQSLKMFLIASIAIAGTYIILNGQAPLSGDATVTGNVTVSSTCIVTLNESYLQFGSLAPLATSSEIELNITNDGNTAQNVSVNGTDWSGAGSINVGQTKYNETSSGTYAQKTSLVNAAAAQIWTSQAAADTNTTYWMVRIPASQTAGSYTQTIEISNTC